MRFLLPSTLCKPGAKRHKPAKFGEGADASRVVARVIVFTVMLNCATAFVATLTFAYSIQSIPRQIHDSTYASPFISVFANAAAIAMTMPWTVIAPASCVNLINHPFSPPAPPPP